MGDKIKVGDLVHWESRVDSHLSGDYKVVEQASANVFYIQEERDSAILLADRVDMRLLTNHEGRKRVEKAPLTLSMYEIPIGAGARVAVWPENITVFVRDTNVAQFVDGGVYMHNDGTGISYLVDMTFDEACAAVEAARSINAYRVVQMKEVRDEAG